jgi:hypothetical protein
MVQLDLHNFFGVLMVGWIALVATTGTALGMGSIALAHWQETDLKSIDVTRVRPSRDPAIGPTSAVAAAKAAMPEREPRLVVYPSTDFTCPRNFMVLMYGKEPYNRRLFDVVLIDSQSGAVLFVTGNGAWLWWQRRSPRVARPQNTRLAL